ncbi:MAG: NADH-quinone oxidoreductase subunit N, partial [Chitinophagia bacterium]|nr:NADH-quinone oxidoreductase subunit N [Chitinophagia bacterium]
MKAIIATTLFGVIMMFAGALANNKKTVTTLASLLFLALLGVNIYELFNPVTDVQGMPWLNNALSLSNPQSLWFATTMTGCTLLYSLLMGREIQKVGSHVAEYFALIFFIL